MPQVVLAISAWVAAHAFAAMVIGAAINIGLSFVMRALAPKPTLSAAATQGREFSVQQSAPYRQIIFGQRVVGGAFLPVTIAGASNEFWYFIMLWCEGLGNQIEEIAEIRFGDEIAVTGTTPIGKYSGYITVEHHLGTDAQTASSLLTTDVPATWTSTDRLRGIAYTVFKLKYDADKFSDFNLQQVRARIKGAHVLNRRTGAMGYSTNVVDCALQYLTNTRFGVGVGAAKLDDTANNASANVCDELVSVKAGGTRARYALAAAFTTEAEPGRTLEEFRKSCAGTLTFAGMRWQLRAGMWRPPLLPTLTDSDLRGPVELQATQGRKNLANGVKGQFMDTTKWQPTSYPAVAPAKYLTEDGDARLWETLDFAFVTDAGQAQQLALIHLRKLRQQKRIALALKVLAYELVPGDVFAFTHTAFAGKETWVGKTFFVERIGLAVLQEEGGQTLGVNVDGAEENAEVYAWNAAVDEMTFTAPASPTLPSASPAVLVAPGGDPTLRPGVLGVMTYRPMTNPLTATDAGATATVNVAAFTQRIQGVADKSINSGSVTGLSFSTLYFIYYDDAGFAGGAVTYAAATTKETAINGAGRFFVGSILTPADGGADTVGFNDGGVGAQTGGHISRKPTTETTVGTVTGSGNAKDGDWGTKLTARTPAAGVGNITNLNTSVKLSGFGLADDFGRFFKNLKLTVKANASVGNESDATGTSTLRVRYSVNGGSSWTDVRTATAVGAGASASLALQTDVVALPDGSDPGQVQAEVRAEGHSGGANNDGDLTSEMYEAVLEGDL